MKGKKPDSPPCRLYALLAREAPVGVVFRRGPSKWVQTIHWDTSTDTFTPGQWFHGRIYERRGDISPQGKLLIYSARKENTHTRNDKEYTEFWTAISRLPYLTALALWPCRSSVGGGLFLSDTGVWLNHTGGAEPHPNHRPQGLKVDTSGPDVLEQVVLDRRLEREGWRHVQEWRGEKNEWRGYVTHAPSVREKRHPEDILSLLMATTITGYEHRYAYRISGRDGLDLPLDGAEWADWDQAGRLVFAREGRLFAQAAEDIGRGDPHELTDLNGHRHEPVEAPAWAKAW